MTIETKFNLEDEVFIIENFKIKKGEITAISFQILKGDLNSNLMYTVRTNTGLCIIYKDNLFKSREELIASL